MKTYAIWKYTGSCEMPEKELSFFGVFDEVISYSDYDCEKVYESTDLTDAMKVWHDEWEGAVETKIDREYNRMIATVTEIAEYDDGKFTCSLDWSSDGMPDDWKGGEEC